MERFKYHSFAVPEELREMLRQKMEEYRERMTRILMKNLIKTEVISPNPPGPLTKSYLMAYYKLKMIELGLEKGFVDYRAAKIIIGKLPLIHDQKYLKEAYKHLRHYCDGTLTLSTRNGTDSGEDV